MVIPSVPGPFLVMVPNRPTCSFLLNLFLLREIIYA
jgi:hypothetical protein